MLRILAILGTRPEAIKLAPVIHALRRYPADLQVRVCVTGQHRAMLDQVLAAFQLTPDIDLNLMQADQTLPDLTARLVAGVNGVLLAEQPHLVLVQGDTTTVMASALAAFYQRIPVAHVEAGLRSLDAYSPFPEEMNRRLVGLLATYHFAPVEANRAALLRENVPAAQVFVTGNTVIDALHHMLAQAVPLRARQLLEETGVLAGRRRLILVTAHRRENLGPRLEAICQAVRALAERNPDVVLVYPVHLNPQVQGPVHRLLDGVERVVLTEPLEYDVMAHVLQAATLALTDSGGLQEEAPALHKPVLVMRAETERPEGIAAGAARLVGTDPDRIVAETERLLHDPAAYAAMASAASPYGDGQAAGRIVGIIRQLLLPMVTAATPPPSDPPAAPPLPSAPLRERPPLAAPAAASNPLQFARDALAGRWPWAPYGVLAGLAGLLVLYLAYTARAIQAPWHLFGGAGSTKLGWVTVAALPVIALVALALSRGLERYRIGLLRGLAVLTLTAGVALTFTSGSAWAVGAWLVLLLAASAVGRQGLAWLGLADQPPLTRTALSLALGLGFLSVLGFVLGLLTLYTVSTVVVVLAVVLAVLYRQHLRLAADLRHLWRAGEAYLRSESTPLSLLLIAGVAVCLLVSYIQVLSPEVQFDAIYYHLPVSELYLAHHGIVEVPYIYNSYFARGVNFQQVLALLLAGDTAVRLLTFAAEVVVCLQTAALVRSAGRSRFTALIALALFVTIPMAGWASSNSYVDLGVTVFAMGAVLAVLLWRPQPTVRGALLIGLFSGLCVFGKLQTLTLLGPLGLYVLYRLGRVPGWPARLAQAAALIGPAVLIGAPWYLVVFLWTGNPVFPFYNGVFRSPYFRIQNVTFGLELFGNPKNLSGLLTLPWSMTYDTDRFLEANQSQGLLGITLWPALVWPLVASAAGRRWAWLVTLLVGGGTLAWALNAQYMRYYIPLLPLIAVLGALTFSALADRLAAGPWVALRHMGVVASAALLLTGALAGAVMTLNIWWNVAGRVPLKVVAGLETREAYLARALPDYAGYQYLEHAPGPSPVVLSFVPDLNNYRPITQLYPAHSGWLYSWIHPYLSDPARLAQALADLGVTHLLFYTDTSANSPTPISEQFLHDYTVPEYANNLTAVLRLAPAGAASAAPVTLPLADGGLDALGQPGGWQSVGAPAAVCGAGAYAGQCAAQLDVNTYLYQTVPVTGGALVELSFAARADTPSTLLALQVNWLDAAGQVLAVTPRNRTLDLAWARYTTYFAAPPGATQAALYLQGAVAPALVDAVMLEQFQPPVGAPDPAAPPPKLLTVPDWRALLACPQTGVCPVIVAQ